MTRRRSNGPEVSPLMSLIKAPFPLVPAYSVISMGNYERLLFTEIYSNESGGG